MKNKTSKRICTFMALVFVITSAAITAQSLSKARASVQEEAAITWEEPRLGYTEYQSIEFENDKMVITRKTIFKDKHEAVQLSTIPISRIDPSRLHSYEHIGVEGMFYLTVFIKNDEKAITTTTDYGNDEQENIVHTHYYTIYSKNKAQSDALKAKIEQLIYLVGG